MSIDWNITLNFTIAIVAVFGFLSSLTISIITLKQTKKLNEETLETTRKLNEETLETTRKLNKETLETTRKFHIQVIDAQLFEKRFEVLKYFLDYFSDRPYLEPPKNLDRFHENIIKMQLLFDEDSKYLWLYCKYLLRYYENKEPLPDFTSEYKEELLEQGFDENNIAAAFSLHIQSCISILRDRIFIDKDKANKYVSQKS